MDGFQSDREPGHEPGEPAPESPVTAGRLADLQAGLLDDTTAARLRRAVRSDPDAAATLAGLDAVRRDLAHLGTDAASAPPVPADVTSRVGAALRDAPRHGTHTVVRPTLSPAQRVALLTGIGAAVTAVVVGALAVTRDAEATFPSGPTAAQITVSAPAFPLTEQELRAAVGVPADLGPLSDPRRRASCLDGLGYPADAQILGGRLLDVDGLPAVLILLPGPTAQRFAAVAVRPSCSGADTGLIAETAVTMP